VHDQSFHALSSIKYEQEGKVLCSIGFLETFFKIGVSSCLLERRGKKARFKVRWFNQFHGSNKCKWMDSLEAFGFI